MINYDDDLGEMPCDSCGQTRCRPNPAPLRIVEDILVRRLRLNGETVARLLLRQDFPVELAGKRCKITIELVEE